MSLELLGRKELRRDPVAKHIQERIAILNEQQGGTGHGYNIPVAH